MLYYFILGVNAMKAVCQEFLRSTMATVIANLLDGCEFRLSIADISPGFLTSVASLTQATFDGYAPVALGAGTAFKDAPTGQRVINIEEQLFWQAGTAATPQTVYCWSIVDNTERMLAAGRFDVPKQINGPGDAIEVQDPLLSIPMDAVESLRSV